MKDMVEKTNKEKETAAASPANQGQGSGKGPGQSPAHASSTTDSQHAQQSEQKASGMQPNGEQGRPPSSQMSNPPTGLGQSQRHLMQGDWFTPSRWMEHPFGLLRRFSEEMDRIFGEFGMGRGGRDAGFNRGREQDHGIWSPQVEMYERDNQLVICADLPGLKKEDIQLEITDNALVIHGERRQEWEDTQEGYRRSERSYGSFYRTIPLPEGMDAEQAKANFQDGVLKIILPLPQEEKQRRRRIEVQGASSSSAAPRQEGSESTSAQERV